MNFKKIGLNTLIYAVYFFGSCVVVMLAETLFMKLVNNLFVTTYGARAVIRVVLYTLGVPALVGFIGYREGYREAACNQVETLLGGVGATILPHLLFAMLFHYQPFVSGGVFFAAGLIHNGIGLSEDILRNETPYMLFVAVFLVYGLIYTGALTLCKSRGAKKRVADRIAMGAAHPDGSPAHE